MSGEAAILSEEFIPIDVPDVENVGLSIEAEDDTNEDPVALFLEKHGNELTRNHKGELVTYYQAVEECPALPMMIRALGERVLNLTAAIQPEEQAVKEVEETSTNDVETEKEVKGVKKQELETQQEKNEPAAEESTSSNDNSQGALSSEKEQETTKTLVGSNTKDDVSPTNVSFESAEVDSRPMQDIKPEARTTTAVKVVLDKVADSGFSNTESKDASISPKKVPKTTFKAAPLKNKNSKKPNVFVQEQAESSRKTTAKLVQLVNEKPEQFSKSSIENLNDSTLAEIGSDSKGGELIDIKITEDEEGAKESFYKVREHANTTQNRAEEFVKENLQKGSDSVDEIGASLEGIQVDDNQTDSLKGMAQQSEENPLANNLSGDSEIQKYLADDKVENTKVNELSVSVEELEQTIHQPTEHIEKLEIEETEEVHQILDKIVIKAREVHAESKTNTEAPEEGAEIETEILEETEEELKGLFIALFNHAEIEYTPEFVDSFVKLSIKNNKDIEKLIDELENEEQAVVHDRGTHEVIKQLLMVVNDMKKAAAHACSIGRSVLLLYSL